MDWVSAITTLLLTTNINIRVGYDYFLAISKSFDQNAYDAID
jgi:hypothetical protein